MPRPSFLKNAFFALALGVGACGNAASVPNPPSQPAAGPSPVAAAATVGTATSKFGQIVVDGSGRTLYLFEADEGTTSTCYSACVQEWPPALTGGQPTTGPGASTSLLGTTLRHDGREEVTYAGHPLYYFARDTKPGDTAGQNLDDNGGLWYVLSPAGTAITPQASTAASPSTRASAPAAPSAPMPSLQPVAFSGLTPGSYPVHLHSACNGSQAFHIAVLSNLVVGASRSGSLEVPTADFGRGLCLIVYSNPSLTAVLTVRRI